MMTISERMAQVAADVLGCAVGEVERAGMVWGLYPDNTTPGYELREQHRHQIYSYGNEVVTVSFDGDTGNLEWQQGTA